MSQYQPNAAPGRSFIEKINSKFSGLLVAAAVHHHSDKDGSSESDTLIHKAFVNFFESRNEPFPDWLGVKESSRTNRNATLASLRHSHNDPSLSGNNTSQFQPVRASYNSHNSVNLDTNTYTNSNNNNDGSGFATSHTRQNSGTDSEADDRPYTRRANSQLKALYNKSRHHSGTGSMLSRQSQQSQNAPASRSNSSGQRLRDRVMHSATYSGESAPRTMWGRHL